MVFLGPEDRGSLCRSHHQVWVPAHLWAATRSSVWAPPLGEVEIDLRSLIRCEVHVDQSTVDENLLEESLVLLLHARRHVSLFLGVDLVDAQIHFRFHGIQIEAGN